MMIRGLILLLAMLMFGLFALGCSTVDNPVTPQDNSVVSAVNDADNNRVIWDTFRVGFNPADGTAVIMENRDADVHVNVTSFVKPPQCIDCMKIIGSSYIPAQQEWHLTVQIKNPTIMAGRDVRGLVYNLGNKYLKNADGFMNAYLQQDMQFKAFAKADPVRGFWPYAINHEIYNFHFPPGDNFAFVDYIIDASWPTNCKEPIIENISFPERMENGIDVSDLTVEAFDHQGEFFVVFADLTPIGGEPMALFDDGVHGDGEMDDGVFGIEAIKPVALPGVYTINMYAYDIGMLYGWNSFRVEVYGDIVNPPVIDEITMSRTTVLKGSTTETISLECVAHDPDPGDEIEYEWSCTGGSFTDDEGPTAVWKSPSSTGKFYVNCEVTDGHGGYDDMDSGKIRVTKYAVLNPAQASGFTSNDLFTGDTFTLSDYTPGNVVLLDFWLTT